MKVPVHIFLCYIYIYIFYNINLLSSLLIKKHFSLFEIIELNSLSCCVTVWLLHSFQPSFGSPVYSEYVKDNDVLSIVELFTWNAQY